jgi:hypothetical protein
MKLPAFIRQAIEEAIANPPPSALWYQGQRHGREFSAALSLFLDAEVIARVDVVVARRGGTRARLGPRLD